MDKEARRARLLAFFNRLTNSNKDLVLKISEAIQEKRQDVSGDSSETGFIIKTSNGGNAEVSQKSTVT